MGLKFIRSSYMGTERMNKKTRKTAVAVLGYACLLTALDTTGHESQAALLEAHAVPVGAQMLKNDSHHIQVRFVVQRYVYPLSARPTHTTTHHRLYLCLTRSSRPLCSPISSPWVAGPRRQRR